MRKKMVCILLTLVMVLGMVPVSPALAVSKQTESQHLPYEIDDGLQTAIDAVVEPFVKESYDSRAIPGAVVLVAKDGKIIAEKAYGYAYLTDPPETGPLALLDQGARAVNEARNAAASTDAETGTRVSNPVPMTTDTLFDLASVTKVMATTQAIMKLVSDGEIESMDDTVAKYIPKFAQNGKENVTLEQLLTHTSGLSQWEPDYLLFENDRDAVLDYYCTLPLTYPDGKIESENRGKYCYSDINFRMLAYIVEAVSGKSIDEYVKTEIYEPLGLARTTFTPLENGFTEDDCAATSWGDMYEMSMVDEDNLPGWSYDCSAPHYKEGLTKRDGGELGTWRDYTLRGEVNDANTALASGGVSGAAGLFSTASDLAVLGQLMLNGGIYNGVRIYNEAVVDEFTEPRLTEEDQGYGFKLWWGFMGDKANDIRLGSTFGHDGFTGTQVWMDKDTNMTVVVLTNKMNVGSGVSARTDDYAGQYTPAFSSTTSNASSNPAISPKVSYAIYDYFEGRDNMLSPTVKFDSNGGNSVDLQYVELGQTATLPAHPIKDGHVFAGWYGDDGLTTAYDFAAPVTANVTLYAKWTAAAASERLPYAIDEGLKAAIDAAVAPFIAETYGSNSVPGAVVLVAKDGKIVAENAYGYAYLTAPPETGPISLMSQGARAVNEARNTAAATTPENGTRVDIPVPMTTDTLFDLASMTKIMATTQAIMKLVSEGKITSVDDTVAKYIPDFAQNGKENVTLKQLLTHTSGLSQWEPDYLLFENDRVAVLEFYCGLPLTYPAGEGKYAYSDIGFRMLAYVAEAVSGKSIDEYVKTEIYEPLGLTRTTFKPLENGFSKDDCAATSWGNMYEMAMVDEDNLPGWSYDTSAQIYKDGLTKRDAGELGSWRNYTLRGEVNDGNTAMASGGVSGAAGLFSTASDLAVLSQVMLNGGIYNGIRIYDEAVVDEFTLPRLEDEDQGYGFKLWWGFMGDKENDITLNTFGHDGFTGTQIWMDKDTNMTVVVLTNKMNVGSGVSARTGDYAGQYTPAYSNTLSKGRISPVTSNTVYDYFGGRSEMLSCAVRFDTNGGSNVANQYVKSGQAAVAPAIPTKSGYTFSGWYSDEGLTSAYDFATFITENSTLYAKWRENATSGGGTSSTTTETTKNEDGSITKTVTDKKTGAVTETTTYPDGTKIVVTTPKDGKTAIHVTVPSGKDSVTVTIPMPKKPAPGEVAVIIRPDGTKEILKTSVSTEDGLRITLTEGAKLEIMDNSKRFADVATNSWAADAVQFAASRELFQGTGATSFGPMHSMTRGMLATVLARLDGQDTTEGETWYSAGMDWAKEQGISDGTAPEAEITRESLAVMLYRYAKAKPTDGEVLNGFPDAEKVSDWAEAAMYWAVQSGILVGTGTGELNPGGNASRAEVAAVLMRFVQNGTR